MVSECMKVKVKSLSHVRLFGTPWTVAYQGPPSMGFCRQECWSRLPFPSPGDRTRVSCISGSPSECTMYNATLLHERGGIMLALSPTALNFLKMKAKCYQ